jgi:putative membrane protein
MKRFLITLMISALSLLITAHLIDGFELTGVKSAVLAAIALGLVNATIRPVLSFLTFPIRFLTLGAFSFVINALMLWGVSLVISPGFTISGPFPALIGSLVLTVVSGILNLLFNPKKR